MVTQNCPNQRYQNQQYPYPIKRLMISIPAPVANSTSTSRAVPVTVKFARPKRRTLNPAAVDPAMFRNKRSTVVVTARGAGKNIANIFF